MNTESIFRVLLPILIISFAAHRGYYVKYRSKPEIDTIRRREEGIVSKIAGFLGIAGFASMLIYVSGLNWLSFAHLSFPQWTRWTGVGIAIFGFILLQWAQNTLASSWSDTPRILKEQVLITSGPYHAIRHPIYTAFLLILGSPLLIASNWLIGLCWFGMTALEVNSRINFEESLMLEFFGGQYCEYMKQTGRLFPKII